MNAKQTDIIIIGAGAAGLSAAVSAAQGGASVIVFEKSSITGGTANKGMGPLGIESRHTRLRQLKPTKDEAFEAFMNYTHWRVDAQMVRVFLNKSGDTIHWLESLGVEFTEPASYFSEAYPTWHLVKPQAGEPGPGGAATMMKILTVNALASGVNIMMEAPVQKILTEGNKVVGVIANDKDGNEISWYSKAVIVATGGFGDSPQMVLEQTGFTLGRDMHSFRIPGLVGDGIKMALEAGAETTGMTMEIVYGMPDVLSIPPQLHEACRQPHLMVNLFGERFYNEAKLPNVTFAGNAIAQQKDKCAFLIFDESILKIMESDFDFRNRVFPATNIGNAQTIIDEFMKTGYKHFFIADSMEELAQQTGIDINGLKETLATYNQSCKNGYDELFNKDHKYLRPIESPGFYAARHFPGAYGSAGGIKINHKTEVIDKNWQTIPGLFAAGTDACSIYGDSYPFIFPGTSMGFAINTGRIAAENVVKYIKKIEDA